MHEIGIWFLLMGLFMPRITLLFWWLCGNLPYNDTPLVADVFASIFIPRILILVYIYSLQGFSPWFWIHMVGLAISWTLGVVRVVAHQSKQNA